MVNILFFSTNHIKDKPFYKITVYKTEELPLIGHNKKNFDHDESEDENVEEWVAPYVMKKETLSIIT